MITKHDVTSDSWLAGQYIIFSEFYYHYHWRELDCHPCISQMRHGMCVSPSQITLEPIQWYCFLLFQSGQIILACSRGKDFWQIFFSGIQCLQLIKVKLWWPNKQNQLGLYARKHVFGGLRTTKTQTSLRIYADWSAPLSFAFGKVTYLTLLRAKFQFSS